MSYLGSFSRGIHGIVLGMITLPAVKPGEPICHLGIPSRSVGRIQREMNRAAGDSLHHRLRDDLASSVTVSEQED